MAFPHAKIRLRLLAITLMLATAQAAAAAAASCSAGSSAQRVALLELYTSEGCSNCPPADRWLSKLAADKSVPATLLPLAFHVDYWNDLGWEDPFSQAAFSERQRLHSRRRGSRFVVTPQLLLDGQNYQRPFFGEDIGSRAGAINRSAPRAAIRLDQTRTAGAIAAHVDVRVLDDAARQAQVFIALYENNLETAVKAGENRGAVLRHDFVVRELRAPLALAAGGRLMHDANFRVLPHWKAGDLHLAVFVQDPGSGEVLQALSAFCR